MTARNVGAVAAYIFEALTAYRALAIVYLIYSVAAGVNIVALGQFRIQHILSMPVVCCWRALGQGIQSGR